MKSIFRFLIICSFIILELNATINEKVPNITNLNEPFIFEFEAVGNEVKFPIIDKIDNYSVQELSSSTSTTIINSQITKKISKRYSLYPTKDFIIPSFEFLIDDKKEYSNQKNIKVVKPQKTDSDIFDLTIKSSKNDLYVGENFILTIFFKFKKTAQILDLSMQKPNFENFWFKQLNDSTQYEKDGYIIQELKFLMFPLKNGTLEIEPLFVMAQLMNANTNSFSYFSKITNDLKIYSNSLSFDVKILPDNIKLIGKFEINSSIDKNKIKAGDAVSYKVKINGIGNIDDIPDLKLQIDDALIYENKPVINTQLKDEKYIGTYEKVFSIIPNKSITIPILELKYFDKEKNEIVKISTIEYKIDVEENTNISNNTLIKPQEKNETKEIVKIVEKSSLTDKILFFILGIFSSLIIFIIYNIYIKRNRNKQEYNTPLIKRIKNSKNQNELLKIVAIYLSKDESLDRLIYGLEKTKDLDLLKKEIIKKIKELKL